MIDQESKGKFDHILYSLLKNHLKFNDQLKNTYFLSKVCGGVSSLIPGVPLLGRINKQDFIAMVDQAAKAYEREYKSLDIQMIDEILDLIAYSERTLSRPNGHLLLSGKTGTGRKQATQLIAHLLNMEFFSPSINRDYSMKEFKRDLKLVLS